MEAVNGAHAALNNLLVKAEAGAETVETRTGEKTVREEAACVVGRALCRIARNNPARVSDDSREYIEHLAETMAEIEAACAGVQRLAA